VPPVLHRAQSAEAAAAVDVVDPPLEGLDEELDEELDELLDAAASLEEDDVRLSVR
jgi:hypothetical protein